jgi:hypothetical protein
LAVGGANGWRCSNSRVCIRAVSRACQPKSRIGVLTCPHFSSIYKILPLRYEITFGHMSCIATIPAAGSPAMSSPPSWDARLQATSHGRLLSCPITRTTTSAPRQGAQSARYVRMRLIVAD